MKALFHPGFALIFAACFASATDFQAYAGSEKKAATYRVPVASPLEPFAQFELPDFKLQRASGKVVIEYTLPVELTGTPQTVKLEGDDTGAEAGDGDGQGRISLVGPIGRAECERTHEALTCEMKYSAVKINQDELIELLAAKSSSFDDFSSRLEVALRFSDDPVGVTTYHY